jgi:hypothetical protein
MNDMVLEWIGYIASAIVLVSLLMSSIVRLRWINLVGAAVFAFYGFMVGVLPAAIMNVGIVIIDVYYLVKIYWSKEYFQILPVDDDSRYLDKFLAFYHDDMKSFQPVGLMEPKDADLKLYILRNMEIAGVFLAKKNDQGDAEILLDYAVPRYRDFQLGRYLFEDNKAVFARMGVKRLIASSSSDSHTKYLKKMGFEVSGDKFVKQL